MLRPDSRLRNPVLGHSRWSDQDGHAPDRWTRPSPGSTTKQATLRTGAQQRLRGRVGEGIEPFKEPYPRRRPCRDCSNDRSLPDRRPFLALSRRCPCYFRRVTSPSRAPKRATDPLRMGPNVVMLGEAVFDFTGLGQFMFQGYPGGSPLNTAIAAARMGARSAVVTQLSTDLFGVELLRHLVANNVDTRYIERSSRASSLAFVSEICGDAHFQFVGEGSADRYYDPTPRPVFHDDVEILCLAPLTCFSEPAHQANLDLIRSHRSRVMVVLDPTVRPALFPDRARWHELFEEILPLVDLVKGSDQDFEWLYPNRSFAESAAAWLEKGPRVVIVTRGEAGVEVIRSNSPTLHEDAPRIVVADTIGAGDTFNGTLFATLLQAGHTIDDLTAYDEPAWHALLARCARAAAINCTRPGCDPPTEEEFASWTF